MTPKDNQNNRRERAKRTILEILNTRYSNAQLGFHPNCRNWHGSELKGCYIQFDEGNMDCIRIYDDSYIKLLERLHELVQWEDNNFCRMELNVS